MTIGSHTSVITCICSTSVLKCLNRDAKEYKYIWEPKLDIESILERVYGKNSTSMPKDVRLVWTKGVPVPLQVDDYCFVFS